MSTENCAAPCAVVDDGEERRVFMVLWRPRNGDQLESERPAFFDHLGIAAREAVHVTGPAGRNVVAVAHDEGGPFIVTAIARYAAGLPPVVEGIRWDVEEILGAGQRPGHFLLY
jgi:hypothetical protein